MEMLYRKEIKRPHRPKKDDTAALISLLVKPDWYYMHNEQEMMTSKMKSTKIVPVEVKPRNSPMLYSSLTYVLFSMLRRVSQLSEIMPSYVNVD